VSVALVRSPSFGHVVAIGNNVLNDAGFEVQRVIVRRSKQNSPIPSVALQDLTPNLGDSRADPTQRSIVDGPLLLVIV